MPELPEVETVCRGLAQNIVHKKIIRVTARRRNLRIPLPAHFEKALAGRTIKNIRRRAKYILIHLDNKAVLIVHLGMSGSLVLYDNPQKNYRKHDHIIFELAPFTLLVFHDPRRFGLMAVTDEKSLHTHPLFTALGPEPFDRTLNTAQFHALLLASKTPVKSVIMDQKRLVGVGNIYACEALFRSHIHPARSANQVTRKEAGILLKNIRKVLEEAIESGGSTLRDYVRSSGDAGYFQHHFSVYGRARQPCTTCHHSVSVIRQSGRSTFLCTHCQK